MWSEMGIDKTGSGEHKAGHTHRPTHTHTDTKKKAAAVSDERSDESAVALTKPS